jgi:hypothetical protein
MPIFSPFENLQIRNAIVGIAKTTGIALYLPVYTTCTETDCGLDAYTGQGVNPNCPTCLGVGRTRVYHIATLQARVAWLDHKQQGVFMSLPTGETADVEIQAELSTEDLFTRVWRTEGAYVALDGHTFTIKSITRNRVENLTSLDVRLAMTNQDVLGVAT